MEKEATTPAIKPSAGAGATESHDAELSREALLASVPELPDGSADLVGWAARVTVSRPGEPAGEGARRLLATALGVSQGSLAGMSDVDVTGAVERIRTLADQCRRLASQVTVDELTGALRRGAGLASLQHEIDRIRRTGDRGLVVVFIDVDGLKLVNDHDGHAAGDDLLRTTVGAIRDRLRSYDLIIRYGGDEFLCVLTGTTLEQAERTAAVLREQVARRASGSISTGLAELVEGDTVDTLVERADAALYASRRRRRSPRAPHHRRGAPEPPTPTA